MGESARVTECAAARRTLSLRLAAGARGLPSIEAGDIEVTRAHLAVCDACRSVVDRLVAAVRAGQGDELSCAEAGSRLATALRPGTEGIEDRDRAWPLLAVHLATCPECRRERDVLVDILGELSRGTLPVVPLERVATFDLSFVDDPTTPASDRPGIVGRRSALAGWMLRARSWIDSLTNRTKTVAERATGAQGPSIGGPARHRRASDGTPVEATRPGRRHWSELAVVAGMALVVIAVMRSVTAPAPQPPAADRATVTAPPPQQATLAAPVSAPTSTEVPGIAPAGRPTRATDADGGLGTPTATGSALATTRAPSGGQARPADDEDRGSPDEAPTRPSRTPETGSGPPTTPTVDPEPYPGPTEVPPATWVPYPGPTENDDPGAETGTPPPPSATAGSAEPTATEGG